MALFVYFDTFAELEKDDTLNKKKFAVEWEKFKYLWKHVLGKSIFMFVVFSIASRCSCRMLSPLPSLPFRFFLPRSSLQLLFFILFLPAPPSAPLSSYHSFLPSSFDPSPVFPGLSRYFLFVILSIVLWKAGWDSFLISFSYFSLKKGGTKEIAAKLTGKS